MKDTDAVTGSRAAPAAIQAAYNQLFHEGYSLNKLKDTALGGRLFDNVNDAEGVPGRSIAWKIFLAPPGPLQPPPEQPPSPNTFLSTLRVSRDEFSRLLLEHMRAPDGSYEDGFLAPGTNAPPQRSGNAGNLDRNNPLSLHDENPWNEWFAAVELRKTISQDVERTFPDIPYFRKPVVQSQLTYILFLYAVLHPTIGYRQGMHELLAPLYYAVEYDSLPDLEPSSSAVADELREMCASRWAAADAWMLFDSVMRAAGKWYEWREDGPNSTGGLNMNGQLNSSDTQLYVAPILQACAKIQKEMLKRVDPALWGSMDAAGIEPQIFGIRWLRLLFTREFNMHDAMVLWDGLFAVDPALDLTLWICVAMLIRIRNRLIPSDYSAQLTYLLRYPTPPATSSAHHATLLLHQALTLQMAPTVSTGAAIVLENRNMLNIPTEVPDPPAPPMRRGSRPGDAQRRRQSESGGDLRPRGADPTLGRHTYGRASGTQLGLPEIIAKNLYDRGEALGINKTLFNAVSEIKRNLPDLAAGLVRTPPTASVAFADYPLIDERPPEERPPWEPRTRFEMERDIAQMRNTQKQLGESVGWIVDTLLLDESGEDDAAKVKQVQARKREALESLAYVRDVLLGSITDLDEERLVSEDEFKKRKARQREEKERMERERQAGHQTSSSMPRLGITTVQLPPPAPPLLNPKTPSQPPAAAPRAPASAAPPPRPDPLCSSSSVSREKSSSASSGTRPQANLPRAPWNYSRSDFSGKGGFGAAVPSLVPPPRASTARLTSPNGNMSMASAYPPVPQEDDPRERSPTMTKAAHDPLGALK